MIFKFKYRVFNIYPQFSQLLHVFMHNIMSHLLSKLGMYINIQL